MSIYKGVLGVFGGGIGTFVLPKCDTGLEHRPDLYRLFIIIFFFVVLSPTG